MTVKPNYYAWQIPAVAWQTISPAEKLKHLLHYGVIAPSAHNTQPWVFGIDGEKRVISVYLMRERVLSVSDPAGREAMMSLGAAIENIVIAAEAYGGSAVVRRVRKKGGNHVADILVKFKKTDSVDTAALETMVQRRSNRSGYRDKRLPASMLKSFDDVRGDGVTVDLVTTPPSRQKVAALVAQADLALMDSTFKRELSQWVRHNWTGDFTGMPAKVQGVPGPVSLLTSLLVARAPIEKSQAKKDRRQLAAAPCLLAVCSTDDDETHWLEAGRVFERVSLLAVHFGLATSAYTSVVEYEPTREALQKLLGTSEHPMALLRIGYAGRQMPHSPRLPVDAVLIN